MGRHFLTIHLTLAHWPYAWAGTPKPDATRRSIAPRTAKAVAEVDRQFGDVMRLLPSKGVLENAIVVLLSDHGEALGGEDDSMLRQTGTSREIWDSLWGHGTSVHEPAPIPGAAGGARIRPRAAAGRRARLRLARDARGPATHAGRAGYGQLRRQDVDGVSLRALHGGNCARQSRFGRASDSRRRTSTRRETLAGRYEVSGIVDEAAVYYEIDRASGWVQFRADRLPDLLAAKQRAAFSPGNLCWQPSRVRPPGRRGIYLRAAGILTRRSWRVSGGLDPIEARRLWEALKARYPGELPAPPDLP